MCEVAFESTAWEHTEPPDDTSVAGQVERNLYKAKFMAKAIRQRALKRIAAFEQLIVLEVDAGLPLLAISSAVAPRSPVGIEADKRWLFYAVIAHPGWWTREARPKCALHR